mmetsp:Transcript_33700/g.89981  ORF Transcript_33700/g.89981 Transcript_33700/m.89981 type:complete len:83 (-) Transcript_33700:349-597(-)
MASTLVMDHVSFGPQRSGQWHLLPKLRVELVCRIFPATQVRSEVCDPCDWIGLNTGPLERVTARGKKIASVLEQSSAARHPR